MGSDIQIFSSFFTQLCNNHSVELQGGAYDSLITRAIADALAQTQLVPTNPPLDPAEAPDQFARLVAEVTRRAIASIPTADRAVVGAELTNAILETIRTQWEKVDTRPDRVQTEPEPQVLTALTPPTPTGEPAKLEHPHTPLAQTSLLTNAPKEPNLLFELASELASADSVEILGAFIRFSGIRRLLSAIRRLTERGGTVRVMTTTYTGTTEAKALTALQAAGADRFDRHAALLWDAVSYANANQRQIRNAVVSGSTVGFWVWRRPCPDRGSR